MWQHDLHSLTWDRVVSEASATTASWRWAEEDGRDARRCEHETSCHTKDEAKWGKEQEVSGGAHCPSTLKTRHRPFPSCVAPSRIGHGLPDIDGEAASGSSNGRIQFGPTAVDFKSLCFPFARLRRPVRYSTPSRSVAPPILLPRPHAMISMGSHSTSVTVMQPNNRPVVMRDDQTRRVGIETATGHDV